ncbi:hypothetical protein GOV10_03385 [Candidatus Woesearchaeota archaeon]|nr:hypothetical protein [Candidatus Woesearchaeota archaeon]
MVSNKIVYEKVVEFRKRLPEFYEAISLGGFRNPGQVLEAVKEAGVLYEDIKTVPSDELEQDTSKKNEQRYKYVDAFMDNFDGKKKPVKDGIDSLLG